MPQICSESNIVQFGGSEEQGKSQQGVLGCGKWLHNFRFSSMLFHILYTGQEIWYCGAFEDN